MGHQQAESDTGPEIGPTLKWATKRPKLRSDNKWPIRFMAVNGLKDTPGRKLAQHLNGSLKGQKMYILKIGTSIKWVVNRPKSHRADIEPKYIAGC